MAAEGPGHDPDVDEEFARIVAGWDDVAPTSGSSHLPPDPPSVQRVEREAHEPTSEAAPPPPADAEAEAERAAGDPAYLPEGEPWRSYVPDEEPDEHFEPPEPQLPPAHDATYWLAVVGMVAGPLLVLWAVVFSGNPDPGWLIVAGLLLLGFGFGLLVMRGSGERDPGDDGSRV
ncbi:MAG: hypothetical protein WCG47_28030 [Dermatophilaceae bacterium]